MTDRTTARQVSRLKVITLVFTEDGKFQGVRGRDGKLAAIKLETHPDRDLVSDLLTDPPKPVPIPPPGPPPANDSSICASTVEIRVGGTKVAHLDPRR